MALEEKDIQMIRKAVADAIGPLKEEVRKLKEIVKEKLEVDIHETY